MDEDQINTLGSKMRDVYSDLASEAPVPAAAKPPSRRLRKNRSFARTNARGAAAPGNIVMQHPVASLLIAVGVGYLLARL